jgi:hypothetical protein
MGTRIKREDEQIEIVICILIAQQTCSYRITRGRIEMERAIQRLSCHDIPVLALEVSLFCERYASQIDGPKQLIRILHTKISGHPLTSCIGSNLFQELGTAWKLLR